jgi:hypothetical protein
MATEEWGFRSTAVFEEVYIHERDVKTVFTKTTKSDKSLIDENR